MNKQKFINILKDYHNIPDEDRNKLHDLVKSYPYSQILHTLVAKANHDAKTEIADRTLHYAAMYATDRAVLKNIIEENPYTRDLKVKKTVAIPKTKKAVISEYKRTAAKARPTEKKTVITPPKEVIADEIPEKEQNTPKFQTDNAADLLRNRVILDLEALKKSKASYLQWANAQTNDGQTEELEKDKNKNNKAPATRSSTTIQKTTITKDKSSPSKKKKPDKAKEKKTVKSNTTQGVQKKKSSTSSVTTEKKPRETNPKKPAWDEQNRLIEKFIKKEPTIKAKPGKLPDTQSDLSEASTTFNEDLVSENLAQILIKQGKKDKAIDIYKKLIWKFPQKKAYFASQIENLQK